MPSAKQELQLVTFFWSWLTRFQSSSMLPILLTLSPLDSLVIWQSIRWYPESEDGSHRSAHSWPRHPRVTCDEVITNNRYTLWPIYKTQKSPYPDELLATWSPLNSGFIEAVWFSRSVAIKEQVTQLILTVLIKASFIPLFSVLKTEPFCYRVLFSTLSFSSRPKILYSSPVVMSFA